MSGDPKTNEFELPTEKDSEPKNPSGRRSCDPFHFKARLMSAFGTKRTSPFAPHMSAFGGKADMAFCTAHVCF